MKTLIVYDNTGKVFTEMSGEYLIPQGGIQYLEVEIPEGKQVTGVDVSQTTHQAILKDVPKSDFQILKERQDATENALLDLLIGGM